MSKEARRWPCSPSIWLVWIRTFSTIVGEHKKLTDPKWCTPGPNPPLTLERHLSPCYVVYPNNSDQSPKNVRHDPRQEH